MAEKSKRKVWTKEETLLFLKCYSERKEEFSHSRKKKFAYQNVLEDMIFQGFTDTSVNVPALVAKMRTLMHAYKSAKDNARQTGTAPRTVPYMDEMDKIFGKALTEGREDQSVTQSSESTPIPDELDAPTPYEFLEVNVASANPSPCFTKSARQRYFEAKLELKKKSYAEREQFQEEIKRLMKKLVDKQDALLKIEERRLQIEEEKLKILKRNTEIK